MCSLDAEGAFDTVPHAILFEKAINVIPDYCCVIMVKWYRSVSVQVKRGSILREPIKVCKGIPFLTVPVDFFYQDLINELSQCTGAININNVSFIVFYYADDLMLASLTFSGLQHLIVVANKYITEHGLRFNPSKPECTIFGNYTLDPHP